MPMCKEDPHTHLPPPPGENTYLWYFWSLRLSRPKGLLGWKGPFSPNSPEAVGHGPHISMVGPRRAGMKIRLQSNGWAHYARPRLNAQLP